MIKILIVEDEKPINDLIKFNLELSGYQCDQVFDGEEALYKAFSNHYDLVILDVMLPRLSGFDVIQELQGIPVILLTAKTGIQDRLQGLHLGADDYITKPFEILELVARVKAVLRRTKRDQQYIEFDDIRVEFNTRCVYKGGQKISLKPKEYDLLEALIANRNLALSRERLIKLVWNFDYEGDTRTVDVHIQRLRQKLGLAARLHTVYKTGYRLEL